MPKFDNQADLLAYLATLDWTPDPNLSTGSNSTDDGNLADLINQLPPDSVSVTKPPPPPTDLHITIPPPPVVVHIDGMAAEKYITDTIARGSARGTGIVMPVIPVQLANDSKWEKNSEGTSFLNHFWVSQSKPTVTVNGDLIVLDAMNTMNIPFGDSASQYSWDIVSTGNTTDWTVEFIGGQAITTQNANGISVLHVGSIRHDMGMVVTFKCNNVTYRIYYNIIYAADLQGTWVSLIDFFGQFYTMRSYNKGILVGSNWFSQPSVGFRGTAGPATCQIDTNDAFQNGQDFSTFKFDKMRVTFTGATTLSCHFEWAGVNLTKSFSSGDIVDLSASSFFDFTNMTFTGQIGVPFTISKIEFILTKASNWIDTAGHWESQVHSEVTGGSIWKRAEGAFWNQAAIAFEVSLSPTVQKVIPVSHCSELQSALAGGGPYSIYFYTVDLETTEGLYPGYAYTVSYAGAGNISATIIAINGNQAHVSAYFTLKPEASVTMNHISLDMLTPGPNPQGGAALIGNAGSTGIYTFRTGYTPAVPNIGYLLYQGTIGSFFMLVKI